ncbi:MAG: zinc-ribbon domain-containing protein [Lachnospiraceae bacterium]
MFCTKCGNQLKDNDKFCPKCGNPVQAAPQVPVQPQEPVQAESTEAKTPVQNPEPVQAEPVAAEMPQILPQEKAPAPAKKKGKAGIVAACAALGILLVAAGVFLCVKFLGKEDADKGDKSGKETETSTDTVSGNTASAEEVPLYYIEDIGEIDIHAQNYTPGTRVEGMVWDSTLFYWLEDVSSTDSSDGNIADCQIYKTQLRDAETGNLIQYEIYKDPSSGEVYKIVSIEKLENSLRLIDYYYDGGKPNFIFMREDSVYTPTYATIGKVGNRYYYEEDVMVRWRNILTPNVITEYVLTPGEVGYVQAAYANLSAEEQNAYDITEIQMLNAAYNTYNAVAGATGIGLVEGRLTDTAGVPVSGVSVKIYRKEDNVLLYETVTDAEGYFSIYTYLDNTECYLVIKETETYKAYTMNNICLNVSTLGYSCQDIVLHKISGDEYPVYVDVCSVLEVQDSGEGTVTGSLLQGASVTIREGAGTYEGEVLKTLEADENGRLHTSLPSGIYTAQIQLSGYADSYLEIEVAERETTATCYVMPAPSPGETGVVLTWSGTEADLDLTLFTPYQSTGGDMAHIGGSIVADDHGNRLVSDNSAYCEAMYINTAEAGSYKLYVNNYTDSLAGNYGSSVLSELEIHIYIYDSNGFVAEYTFPAGRSGVVWEVMEINGTKLTASGRVYEQVDGKTWWVENKKALNLDECGSLKTLLTAMAGSLCAYDNSTNEFSTYADALFAGDWSMVTAIIHGFEWSGYEEFSYLYELQKQSESQELNESFSGGIHLTAPQIEYIASSITGEERHLDSFSELGVYVPVYGEYAGFGYAVSVNGPYCRIYLENYTSEYVGGNTWEITADCMFGTDWCPDYQFAVITATVVRNPDSCFDGFSVIDIKAEEVDTEEWRQAYYDFLINSDYAYEIDGEYSYQYDYYMGKIYYLLYVDDDAIPEIYVRGSDYAGGDQLLYYQDGQIYEEYFCNYGGNYIPRSGMMLNSGGHMGGYYDEVWQLENGEFQMIASGWTDYNDENGYPVYDENEDMTLQKGEWNGQSVTSEEEYAALLRESYNTDNSESCCDGFLQRIGDIDEVLRFLQNMELY